ncbi:DUF6915 family protein [Deinococcus aquatilis]|uniref:DUF6915 family protein n=1 Tax=Deinococcus aquatilis TaxID=519440 RepID=UPI003CCBB8A0
MRHRALLYSSSGVFLCKQVFGPTLRPVNGKQRAVRLIGEQHVIPQHRHRRRPAPPPHSFPPSAAGAPRPHVPEGMVIWTLILT